MRLLHPTIATLLLSAATAATAAPCYVILDRDDAVIYRDYKPPFDMSDSNAPERSLMRSKGQHLIVAEFGEDCNPVGFISPTTGANTASVDEIVGGVRSAVATSVASTGATKTAPQPGAKPAPKATSK
ncbi:MAG: hypothetical protein U1F41_11675 [Burkholderiales bacterium]